MMPARLMTQEAMIAAVASRRYPGVTDFAIDHTATNVRPVEFLQAGGRRHLAYPPVVRWRVGERRYAYVLKPTFRVERWRCWLVNGFAIIDDYSEEEGKLWRLLEWSVAGNSAAAMCEQGEDK